MKKIIVPVICIILLGITFLFINPITDTLASFISNEQVIVVNPDNLYTKDNDYLFVKRTNDYIPYSYQDLKTIFKDYGESKFASNIALKIVKYREEKEIKTTLELVDIIKSAVPYKEKIKKHPAKQIFQALRIEVNKELDVLEKSLDEALSLLNVGGRVAVITFQSLEDKIVKNKFKSVSEIDEISRGLPNVPKEKLPDFKLITKKGIKPSEEELEKNRRAHSATLRVIEKVK